MQVKLIPYQLALSHTFGISRESYDIQDTLIVALTQNGITGYGEATSNPYYKATIASMSAEINAVKTRIEQKPLEAPEAFYQYLTGLHLSNFAICALDMAYNDLTGKMAGKPLYQLWGQNLASYPKTNYTIGLDAIGKMVEKLKEKPWPLYKIKLGTPHDVEIVKALRAVTDAVFRVDANCAWDEEETVKNSFLLKDLGVEFIEQPLKADNWEGMKKVMAESALPVMADESCIVEEDMAKCKGYFSGVNIKLTKCGGLTPARRMIGQARALGLKVMVGCMTESTVGISAIAQLLPELDYVDMDGALLLKEDIATGVTIRNNGEVVFPDLPGTGVTLTI